MNENNNPTVHEGLIQIAGIAIASIFFWLMWSVYGIGEKFLPSMPIAYRSPGLLDVIFVSICIRYMRGLIR